MGTVFLGGAGAILAAYVYTVPLLFVVFWEREQAIRPDPSVGDVVLVSLVYGVFGVMASYLADHSFRVLTGGCSRLLVTQVRLSKRGRHDGCSRVPGWHSVGNRARRHSCKRALAVRFPGNLLRELRIADRLLPFQCPCVVRPLGARIRTEDFLLPKH